MLDYTRLRRWEGRGETSRSALYFKKDQAHAGNSALLSEQKMRDFLPLQEGNVNLNRLAASEWEALVSPVTGVLGQPLTWLSLETESSPWWLLWNTLMRPEHEQTVKPERETELCVPHQLGHLKPKQPENELKKLKRDHGNQTHPVPLYKHSDCSNASRRMETAIFLIL